MKDKIGIWIDKKRAYIIDIKDEVVRTEIITSEIDDFHPKGGTRSKTPYGPMDTVKEKTYLAKEKNDKNSFFKTIESKILNAEYLYIFGPAQMKNELAKHIEEMKNFKAKIIAVNAADSMTENQIIAEVKNAFLNLK
jgi:NAD-dependent SIR2 family protein deacetylase